MCIDLHWLQTTTVSHERKVKRRMITFNFEIMDCIPVEFNCLKLEEDTKSNINTKSKTWIINSVEELTQNSTSRNSQDVFYIYNNSVQNIFHRHISWMTTNAKDLKRESPHEFHPLGTPEVERHQKQRLRWHDPSYASHRHNAEKRPNHTHPAPLPSSGTEMTTYNTCTVLGTSVVHTVTLKHIG